MIKKILAIILIIIFSLFLTAVVVVYSSIYRPLDTAGEEVLFTVKRGESASEIAENLEQQGVIRDSSYFLFYGRITEKGGRLKPGVYSLSPAMNIPEVISLLVAGGDDRVVIIEGWNLRDIANFLQDNGYVEEDEFYQLVGSPPAYIEGEVISPQSGEHNFTEEFSFLEVVPEGLPLEGFLFPDTYSISPGTPLEEVVRAMLENFEERVVEKTEQSSMSLFEVIVRASLLEKEVRGYEDKRLVAGIIENRLNRNMRLQLDATISYLTGRRSVQIPITETRINSPYNTYVNHGLPKGPVSNPGIESIRAVLNPQSSDYYYYLSKPDGETVFSRTHEEHVEAKNRYLR